MRTRRDQAHPDTDELRKKGILTEAEFEAQKQKLLGSK